MLLGENDRSAVGCPYLIAIHGLKIGADMVPGAGIECLAYLAEQRSYIHIRSLERPQQLACRLSRLGAGALADEQYLRDGLDKLFGALVAACNAAVRAVADRFGNGGDTAYTRAARVGIAARSVASRLFDAVVIGAAVFGLGAGQLKGKQGAGALRPIIRTFGQLCDPPGCSGYLGSIRCAGYVRFV